MTLKRRCFLTFKGMEMLATFSTLNFKRDRNFNDVTAEGSTSSSSSSRRRKVGNLKLQTIFSFRYLAPRNSVSKEEVKELSNKQMVPPKSLAEYDVAAITKLQKLYRSYRTRRKLADCAIVCEELWWKASEFADESESAISKWARARKMAAEVGKGLPKDDRAQKLALRHWLEAIDPRHRYGHNLNFYYDVWFWSQSSQPFFYWLDVGDGKGVELDSCQRGDLQGQRIKYLGPEEREAYEVIVVGGKLVYRHSKKAVQTTEGSKWIFVLSSSRVLYVGQKKKGQFQHSSFLAGAATISSGRLVAHDGVLHAIWPYSGHYRPTAKNFMEFICFLEEHHVDLTNVKKYPVDDDVPHCNPGEVHIEEGNVSSGESATANNNCGHQIGSKMEGSHRESMALPSQWATGVGPRIGCMREYSKELQAEALEQLNLPPRVNNQHETFAISKESITFLRPSMKVHLSPGLVNMDMGLPILGSKQNQSHHNQEKLHKELKIKSKEKLKN